VWEGNLSGSQSNIQEWDVAQDGDQSCFEEETEVSEAVDHALLGEGKISSLANHEIGPLDTYDRDKISRLSKLECFS